MNHFYIVFLYCVFLCSLVKAQPEINYIAPPTVSGATYDIHLQDIVAKKDYCKFRITVVNTSSDYIACDFSKIGFTYKNLGTYYSKGKLTVIKPRQKVVRILRLDDVGIDHRVDEFQLQLEGVYEAVAEELGDPYPTNLKVNEKVEHEYLDGVIKKVSQKNEKYTFSYPFTYTGPRNTFMVVDPSKLEVSNSSNLSITPKQIKILTPQKKSSFNGSFDAVEDDLSLTWGGVFTYYHLIDQLIKPLNIYRVGKEETSRQVTEILKSTSTAIPPSPTINTAVPRTTLVNPSTYNWTQMGRDIDGEALDDQSGESVSLSNNRVAIGATINSDGGKVAGHVRIYEWNGHRWNQLGRDIDGSTPSMELGRSVALDGNYLAVGGVWNRTDFVQVYEWTGNQWQKMGPMLTEVGTSLSLKGNRLVAGNPSHITDKEGGLVKVYEWNGRTWQQMGRTLVGQPGYALGESVSLDGNKVAVGALGRVSSNSYTGLVEVYEWTGRTWNKLGQTIHGTAPRSTHGRGISLNNNRLAIAEGKQEEGYVTVYEWNEGARQWVVLGKRIHRPGENQSQDGFGSAIDLEGNRLAIGADQSNVFEYKSGYAVVYEWVGTEWQQIGMHFNPEARSDKFGRSVSLSGDKFAVGSPTNDGNGSNAGSVRVFTIAKSQAPVVTQQPLVEKPVPPPVVSQGCNSIMNVDNYAQLCNNIKHQNFEQSKVSTANQVIQSNCLSANQIKGIMELFDYEHSRLEFAKKAYQHCSDPNNYYLVNSAFDFELSIQELQRSIK